MSSQKTLIKRVLNLKAISFLLNYYLYSIQTLTDFQLAVYKLIAQEYELARFEAWVYSDKELERILSSDEYLEIISLNYKNASSLYEAQKILKRHINIGKYHEWFMRRILQKIIDRPSDVHKYIAQCYDLYCDGFGFLDDLGLNYGLNVIFPPPNYECWEELTLMEQWKLIDSFYPRVAEEAKKILNWFDNGEIIITGDDGGYQGIKYDDHRSAKENRK